MKNKLWKGSPDGKLPSTVVATAPASNAGKSDLLVPTQVSFRRPQVPAVVSTTPSPPASEIKQSQDNEVGVVDDAGQYEDQNEDILFWDVLPEDFDEFTDCEDSKSLEITYELPPTNLEKAQAWMANCWKGEEVPQNAPSR